MTRISFDSFLSLANYAGFPLFFQKENILIFPNTGQEKDCVEEYERKFL